MKHNYDPIEVTAHFARSFRRHRQRLGLGLKDIAGGSGLSLVTLYKWEEGSCNPTLYCLCAVAQFMGLTLDELVGVRNVKGKGGRT